MIIHETQNVKPIALLTLSDDTNAAQPASDRSPGSDGNNEGREAESDIGDIPVRNGPGLGWLIRTWISLSTMGSLIHAMFKIIIPRRHKRRNLGLFLLGVEQEVQAGWEPHLVSKQARTVVQSLR